MPASAAQLRARRIGRNRRKVTAATKRIDRGRTFGPESLRGRGKIKDKALRKRLSRRAPPGRGRRQPVRRKDSSRDVTLPYSEKKGREGMKRDLRLRQIRRRRQQQRKRTGRRPVRRSVEVTAARNRALLARKRSGSRNTRATQRVARRRRRR